MQEKDDTKPSNAEDGSEDTDAKAKEEKEDSKKDKKKKAKKGKVRSESPEPMVIDDEFRDTQVRHAVYICTVDKLVFAQISAVEGSKGTGSGQAEAKADNERGEVATPTHRSVESNPKGKANMSILYFPKLN